MCYRASDLAEPLLVRLEDGPGGRLEVRDLFIPFDSAPSARRFRELSRHLSLLDRMANDVNDPAMAAAVRRHMAESVPDVRGLVSTFGTNFIKGPVTPQPWPPRPEPIDGLDLAVSVPDRRPYPEEFYVDVSEAYTLAAQVSERPAVLIAEASGVPVRRVHQWIAEARKRGHLPPGVPGRAG